MGNAALDSLDRQPEKVEKNNSPAEVFVIQRCGSIAGTKRSRKN